MNKKKKKVLEGHKQVGKKFIPPILQMKGFNEISYINEILPEIIWMGLINDKLGYRNGIDLCLEFVKKAFDLKETEKHINFSIVSNFDLLSKAAKEQLVAELKKEKIYFKLKRNLLPFFKLYNKFPLNFLNETTLRISKSQAVKEIKNCVSKYFDKFERPSLIIQANITYFRGMTGGLFYFKDMNPPDLNSIFFDHDSEDFQRAASHIRMGALSEFGSPLKKNDNSWASYFWNQNYLLDNCSYWEPKNETN